MIDKALHDITYADIEEFVSEKWPETKILDYKRDCYGGKDDDKKELLKDVSAFANTQGGHILIGVDEDQGLPTTVPGVEVADVDKEKLRMEEIIRRGIEPRIDFGIHSVPLPAGNRHVVIIRILESQGFPHRVVYQGKPGEFWGRHSNSKYSLDTAQLREAFTMSESYADKMKAFRKERVAEILNGNGPVPLEGRGQVILHLIPSAAFRSRYNFDVTKESNNWSQFAPMGASGWDRRLNLDGRVAFHGTTSDKPCHSYTQFFRNGIVEAVESDIVRSRGEHDYLLCNDYEPHLIQALAWCIEGYKKVGVMPPVWGFLSVTQTLRCRPGVRDSWGMQLHPIDKPNLLLPEFLIESFSDAMDSRQAMTLLKPSLDLVWNAAGYSRTPNIDPTGTKWTGA